MQDRPDDESVLDAEQDDLGQRVQDLHDVRQERVQPDDVRTEPDEDRDEDQTVQQGQGECDPEIKNERSIVSSVRHVTSSVKEKVRDRPGLNGDKET